MSEHDHEDLAAILRRLEASGYFALFETNFGDRGSDPGWQLTIDTGVRLSDAEAAAVRRALGGSTCIVNAFSSRACEMGTRGCDTRHKLLLPVECPHETTFLKVPPDGWACRDCGAAVPTEARR